MGHRVKTFYLGIKLRMFSEVEKFGVGGDTDIGIT